MGIALTKPKLRILRALSDDPKHGYVLSQDLDLHVSTVYEHLHQLADENYVEGDDGAEDDRRIVYHLTEKAELILEAQRMDD